RDFVIHPLISSQHPDLLAYWMPTYCHLGASLRQVDIGLHVPSLPIPEWNPFSMAGAPFAADPQSGWMYLPAMLVFGGLPCGVAIRAFVVLQPLIAGLGLYAFLRSERVSRVAATVGA